MELHITLYLLYCCAACTSAAKHLHTTLYTVTRASCHPEFTAVSFVNERQITRYDSENKTLTAMHSWVREALSDQHWEKYKETHLSEYLRLREELNATMRSLGHVKDVHTFQRRSGCEWDDVTGRSKGFDEYGYDGENFISLDLNQMRYVPHTAQANITAERWNRDGALIQSQSSYHTRECVNWLKRFGRTNLEQTGSISFFQRTAFSPVVCHVAGFCPSAMKISWRKDGKDMKENVRIGAALPDGEGTYLRDVSINITELDLNTFSCVVGNTFRDLTKDQLKSENTKYLHTTLYTVTRASCHPEFTAVSFVNERQITRYDSENKTLTAMHSWVREALSDQHWEKYKETHLSEYSRLREELNATMKSLGHVKDVHTFQRRSGCEWDDVTGRSKGFDEYGYDGENFISLDLNQMRYVPHTAQANITAERWNRDGALIQSQSSYHTRECVNWLKRFGRTNLEQTGNISFFQRTAFSPVVCHVAGFCPSAMKISWRKDGKDMKENVRIGAALPDGEGTYLRDVSINITELDLNTFSCVVGNTSRDLTKDQLKSENTKYLHTTLYTVTRASCHPEFMAVSFVNERQITRYDSENKTLTAMHSWVREALSDQHWEKYKETHLSEYLRLREELNATMRSLGHVKDVHTFQRRSGCEWDDVTGRSKGFDEYGYDGENFISLDLNQETSHSSRGRPSPLWSVTSLVSVPAQ
ncbi:uncharacterized protein LOC118814502 isoform X2 [Colossoma macropomum]|uniref:uncharacterized protein LOC118814502 isoform X2 n=1 Tax=Colossoma macropomum TaxID=42526 RepID=UPI001863CE88|nr:uncharacterized protein LOC118814502 isoform X2 [Colossoma macropomum]